MNIQRPFSRSIAAIFSLLLFSPAHADFFASDERLRELYSIDGYFIWPADDLFFWKGESCKRNFLNDSSGSGLWMIQKFQPGALELGTVHFSNARYYRQPIYDRPAARYRVISSEPLTFDVELNTGGGSYLVERYSFMPEYKHLKRLMGVECRNCQGGQKFAFESRRNVERDFTFCSGKP